MADRLTERNTVARAMANLNDRIDELTLQLDQLQVRYNDKSAEFDRISIRYEDETGKEWDGRAFRDP